MCFTLRPGDRYSPDLSRIIAIRPMKLFDYREPNVDEWVNIAHDINNILSIIYYNFTYSLGVTIEIKPNID